MYGWFVTKPSFSKQYTRSILATFCLFFLLIEVVLKNYKEEDNSCINLAMFLNSNNSIKGVFLDPSNNVPDLTYTNVPNWMTYTKVPDRPILTSQIEYTECAMIF